MWILFYIFFILLNILVIFIPKSLSKIEIYASTMFALFFGTNTDLILGRYFDLYSFFGKAIEAKAFIGQYLYYIPINILYLNYFPQNKGLKAKIGYILCWTVFSVWFEWLAEQTSFFNYTGWKLWYSALAYPLIFTILSCNLNLIKQFIKQ